MRIDLPLTVATISLFLIIEPARSFEMATHDRITQSAIDQSDLASRLPDFGITGVQTKLLDPIFRTEAQFFQLLSNGKYVGGSSVAPKCITLDRTHPASVMELVKTGAYCEDAIDVYDYHVLNLYTLRFTRHFYDPAHNGHGLEGNTSALDWALELAPDSKQRYSYQDFKGYLVAAITAKDVNARHANAAIAFRSLGHLMHLIEDMAQPQHTRNDSHGFTNKLFEVFTDGLAEGLIYSGYSPHFLSEHTFQDLWHTHDNKGLADYSNRGFVTAGTNFLGSGTHVRARDDYALPNGADATLISLPVQALNGASGCPGSAIPPHLTGDITFISTGVRDEVTGKTDINQRTSTFSLFDADLQRMGFDQVFTLNRFNFCEAQKLLLPRATAYAAALINYALRGNLEVTMPDDGVFAISGVADANCFNPCSFQKLKVRLRNLSPATDTIGAGNVTAILRHHRNACFRKELSGQPGAPYFTGPQDCRRPAGLQPLNEYIAVSKPVEVPGVSSVDASSVTFDFSGDPIPLDAADVYLQILFQGRLGDEPSGIALGSVDLAEPTFLTFANNYDQVGVYRADGKFVRSEPFAVPPYAPKSPYVLADFSLRLYREEEGEAAPVLASFHRLDPGSYGRLAILTTGPRFFYRIDYRYADMPPDQGYAQAFETDAAAMQIDANNAWFVLPPYATLRKATEAEWIYQPFSAGSTIYWGPGYACENSSACMPEDHTVDEQVRRYPPFLQSIPITMRMDFNERR
jgi:hypothetical protein